MEKDDLLELLHHDILELSKQINSMAAVVKSAGEVRPQTSSGANTLATYDSLASSLEKLKQAFETLHRHGGIVPTLDQNHKTIQPN